MRLQNLHLRAFRNYIDQQVQFADQKTILLGNNAQGKSNLLEAVELLSTLKSHRTSRDRELVLEGSIDGHITATLERSFGESELSLTFRKQGRRTVAVNRENLRRHLDFLGVLNTVQFSSLDLELVRGSPESRRNWLDGLLIQLEPVYAYILQQYNQTLRQRNALLKEIRRQDLDTSNHLKLDLSQLQIWDEQLAAIGSRVTRRRARVLVERQRF
jgi:DNA replication and repair protein RecF